MGKQRFRHDLATEQQVYFHKVSPIVLRAMEHGVWTYFQQFKREEWYGSMCSLLADDSPWLFAFLYNLRNVLFHTIFVRMPVEQIAVQYTSNISFHWTERKFMTRIINLMFPSEVLGIEQPPYKMEASLSLQLLGYNRDSLCVHHPSGPGFSSSPPPSP